MRRTFAARSETFSLELGEKSPSLPALRLLYSAPRVYLPLVEGWATHYPTTRAELDRLTAVGLVAHQPAVIYDTISGIPSTQPTRSVTRWRTTAAGKRLAAEVRVDSRVLEDTFPRLTNANSYAVEQLLNAFNLEDSHAKYGLSSRGAILVSGLPDRTVRWWISQMVKQGLLKEIGEKYADVREVIPEHWRVTRNLGQQISDAADEFMAFPDTLKDELRLGRSRFLTDITPARIGATGATDYDHDIECQRLLKALLGSPHSNVHSMFAVEPRFILPMRIPARGLWQFVSGGADTLTYQPDGEFRTFTADGGIRHDIIEYERYQSRRDAWSHIERYLGYLHTQRLPLEDSILRFVVDTRARERSYVALIEAFADYILDHPERMPANNVTLAVSSQQRVLNASDPLDDTTWFRVSLTNPKDTPTRTPVLHPADDSPYSEYFTRASS